MKLTPLFTAFLCALAAHGSGVVTNCSEAELDAALSGGGLVTFACDGTIYFTNTKVVTNDVVVDGTGHNITLSGNNAVRLFAVNNPRELTLRNLTIANGFSSNSHGGAISNGGSLRLYRCTLVSNIVAGSSSGGFCLGGGIYNRSLVTANECSFLNNHCMGAKGADGGTLFGSGTPGEKGTDAFGGAIFNAVGAVRITNSTFAFNQASGGRGGDGGASLTGGNGPGSGGNGGAAQGPAIFNGGNDVFLVNSTVASNTMVGGDGGVLGVGNNRYGAHNGIGGYAGGALAEYGSAMGLSNATVAGNRAITGTPYTNRVSAINPSNAIANLAGYDFFLWNTIVAGTQGTNSHPYVTDRGNNISSDSSCHFTQPSSRNDTDAQLLALSDNGGPTMTLLPSPSSPAINAISNLASAPLFDQRGFLRNGSADIGAVEFQPPTLTNATFTAGHFRFEVELENGVPHTAEVVNEVDATNWTAIASLMATNRRAMVDDVLITNDLRRFYRVRTQ